MAVCDYFKDAKAAIHQNRGLLTARRQSIEAAAFWFIALRTAAADKLENSSP